MSCRNMLFLRNFFCAAWLHVIPDFIKFAIFQLDQEIETDQNI